MTTDKPSWDTLRDQAADWLAAMDTGEGSREDFEAWRNADPRHAAAFAQVAGALMTVDRVKPALRISTAPVAKTFQRRLLFAGGGVLLAASVAGAFAVAAAKTTLKTDVGERRTLHLPLGGTLEVNTASTVQYRTHDQITEIWLLKGELAFDLSHGGGLCRLHAADRVAEFSDAVVNARLRGNLLDLAVVSGSCALKPVAGGGSNSASSAPIVVPANHAVLSGPREAVVRPLNDMDTAFLTAWPRGELLFEGQTLETAIAEYNRYLPHKIVIADTSLAGIRLGGRFTTHDPKAFLQALHESFGIRATDDGDGDIALTK